MVRALTLVIAILAVGQTSTTTTSAPSRSRRDRDRGDTGIAAARHVYAAVQAGIRSGMLRRVDTTFRCDSSEIDFDAHWYVDSAGVIRRLDLNGGTEDHAEQWSFYYDATQRLRFAFAQRGAVIGSQQEERVYYSADGARIARRVRWLHGPQYPFDPLEPVRNPKEWRAAMCT